jgi:hypothetical protein
VIMVYYGQRWGFRSYVTCIVFLSEKSHNLLATHQDFILR